MKTREEEKLRLIVHVTPEDSILKTDFSINKRLNELFTDNRDEIAERLNEVIAFLKSEGVDLKYKDLAHAFKNQFYTSILVKSIKTSITTASTGVSINLLKLISDESCIADALYGKPLLNAIKQMVNPEIAALVEEQLF